MSLPYVVDAQTSLSPAELQVLQEQYESEASSGHITTQTKFNYAWALVKSQSRQQMLQGVTLLTGMWLGRGAARRGAPRRAAPRGGRVADLACRDLPRGPAAPARVPVLPCARPLQAVQLRRGEAVQRYVAGARAGAADLPGLLLEREPNNMQAQSLNALIEKGVAKGAYFCHTLLHLHGRGLHRDGVAPVSYTHLRAHET